MPFPISLAPFSDSKPLTPQRKHRKLLKDGSGAEVWPESVEKIFVQGSFFLFSLGSSPSSLFLPPRSL